MLWHWVRTSAGAKKYVGVVLDMYEIWKTLVRCAVGVTEWRWVCIKDQL